LKFHHASHICACAFLDSVRSRGSARQCPHRADASAYRRCREKGLPQHLRVPRNASCNISVASFALPTRSSATPSSMRASASSGFALTATENHFSASTNLPACIASPPFCSASPAGWVDGSIPACAKQTGSDNTKHAISSAPGSSFEFLLVPVKSPNLEQGMRRSEPPPLMPRPLRGATLQRIVYRKGGIQENPYPWLNSPGGSSTG